jgi:hypothetical protein
MPKNCQSYLPGHHIHWIPATRVWNTQKRHPITEFKANPDDTFTITYNGQTRVMYYHDPKYLRAVLEQYPDEKWLAVGDTGAIQTNDQIVKWIHLSPTPVKDCAAAYIKEIHVNYDKAVLRTNQLIAILELSGQSKKAKEFLTHLEYIKTLKYWDDHIISSDVFGNPTCTCGKFI